MSGSEILGGVTDVIAVGALYALDAQMKSLSKARQKDKVPTWFRLVTRSIQLCMCQIIRP